MEREFIAEILKPTGEYENYTWRFNFVCFKPMPEPLSQKFSRFEVSQFKLTTTLNFLEEEKEGGSLQRERGGF